MYAIFISSSNTVRGYKKIDYKGEEETFLLDYVLVDELPPEIADTPLNNVVKYVDGSYSLEEIPVPPVVPSLNETVENLSKQLAQKETEIVSLREQMADQTTAILEIYDILTGGV